MPQTLAYQNIDPQLRQAIPKPTHTKFVNDLLRQLTDKRLDWWNNTKCDTSRQFDPSTEHQTPAVLVFSVVSISPTDSLFDGIVNDAAAISRHASSNPLLERLYMSAIFTAHHNNIQTEVVRIFSQTQFTSYQTSLLVINIPRAWSNEWFKKHA